MSDQFTRFLCSKCGDAGHDSWNKALHDGIDHQGMYPIPFILGDNCQCCWHPVVLAYYGAGEPIRAIYGPDSESFDYEAAAMDAIEVNPDVAEVLAFAETRDADWSGGCVAAKAQLQ